MKLIQYQCHQCASAKREEQGMTLVLALFMGMILITGATGLMIRQLTARKLSASESYQQMAENAAINGFNRILADINKNSESDYKGYFLTLRNDEQAWGWRNPNTDEFPLVEPCTKTGSIKTADDQPEGSTEPPKIIQLTNKNKDGKIIKSQRNDGMSDIQLFYRLRGYALAGDGQNSGEGTFQIEGIVKRAADQDGYLARTLLTRSLYIDQRVKGTGDWAVLGGYYMRLGQTTIEGQGKIVLDITNGTPYRGDCNSTLLLQSVGASNDDLKPRIWPVVNRGLPTTGLFITDSDPSAFNEAKDRRSRNSASIRVWSFDDSGSAVRTGCEEIVCTRDEDTKIFRVPNKIQINPNIVKIKQEHICPDSESFECHMYIEHMNLNTTKIHIETGTENNPRPVVVHLGLPSNNSVRVENMSGNIALAKTSEFCGVNNNGNICNNKPERFVITSDSGSTELTCDSASNVLNFSGKSLPSALIHMPKGTVRPSQATLHGVIWAQNICTSGVVEALKLYTDNSQLIAEEEDPVVSVITAADDLWQWTDRGFKGYGQMVVRGIRGTGLDTFRRW